MGKVWKWNINGKQSHLTFTVNMQRIGKKGKKKKKKKGGVLFEIQIWWSSHPHHIINFKIIPRQIFLSAAAPAIMGTKKGGDGRRAQRRR